MKSAQIPDENVRGDLPNDDTKTGGEAQLDIEYLMVYNSFSDNSNN